MTHTLKAWIAPGANPAGDADDWVWRDISTDVRETSPVEITYGKLNERARVDASTCTLTLDNSSGDYVTRNPLGAYFPNLARNCPLRIGTVSGSDDFTRTVSNGWGTSTNGLTWSVSGTASNWAVGSGVGTRVQPTAGVLSSALLVDADAADVTGYFTVSMSAVATGAALVTGAAVRASGESTFYFLTVEFNTGGTVTTKIWRVVSGTLTELAGLNPIPSLTYSANERFRCRYEADGPALRVKVWAEAGSEPDAWHVTATDTQLTGTGVGLAFWRLSANTNTNPTASFDDYEAVGVEFTGGVTEWPARWDMSANNAWAPIQAAGVLRRLQQGSSPIVSPIYRQLAAQSPQGYWPLEDGSDATAASSALSRGIAGVVTDVTFGSTDCPPGAKSAATLNTLSTSRIVGRVSGWSVAQNGYAAMCYLRLESLPPSSTSLPMFEIAAVGTITRWVISCNDASFTVTGYISDGTASVGPSAALHVIDPTQWFAIQLETEESGGNVNWAVIWHQVGDTDFFADSGSYAGTADRITSGTIWAPVAGTLASHLWLGPDELPFVNSTFQLVSAGYAGELASDRIERLCTEGGIPLVLEAGDSEPLGAQRENNLLAALQAAADADMGVLYERGTGLGYRPRTARYNRPVLLELAVASRHLDEPPEPTDDDQQVRNEWTVSRTGGGSATVADDEHIAAEGRYDDSTTINVQADGVLADHAAWRVNLGTWPELRWPRVGLSFTRNPDLLPAWRSRGYGPRLTITTGLDQLSGADPDLIAEGWTQSILPDTWTASLNTSAAKPWDVAVYDDTVSRYDSSSTTLGAAASSTASPLNLSTAVPGDRWTVANAPFGQLISGELVTVHWMTNPGSIAAISGGFEVDLTGWTTVGGSQARSTAQHHVGVASALLTVSGSPSQTYLRPTSRPSVTVGASYRTTVWVYSVAGMSNVQAAIDWFDSGGSYLSTSAGTLTVIPAATWTPLTVTGVAPASAATAAYGPTMGSSPANGTELYVDDVDLVAVADADSTTGPWRQYAFVIRSVNGVVKALPISAEVHVSTPGRWAL